MPGKRRMQIRAVVRIEDARNREGSGRLDCVVAGARYAPVCTLPMPLRLPVQGRVGAS
jgi:hypothetical protein